MPGRTRPQLRERTIGALSWLWASCQKVSLSESEALERKRSGWECLMVNAHQVSCPACRRFRRQVRFLGAELGRIRAGREAGERLPDLFLPPDVRERIKTSLRRPGNPGGPALPRTPTD
jgi:hypothetical protein